MMTLSLGKLAAAVGGVAVAWSAATGVASADPIVDTTCDYGQVMRALHATDPACDGIEGRREKQTKAGHAQHAKEHGRAQRLPHLGSSSSRRRQRSNAEDEGE